MNFPAESFSVQDFLAFDILDANEVAYGLGAHGQILGEHNASLAASAHQPWLQSKPPPSSLEASGYNFVQDSIPVSRVQSKIVGSKRKGKRQYSSRFALASGPSPATSSPPEPTDIGADPAKPFHCTECPKSFKDVYSWKRHESGVHWHIEREWVCMLDGALPMGTQCIFCSDTVHNIEHYNRHAVQTCLHRNLCERRFARKDLLKQHVRQIHLSDLDESNLQAFQVPHTWSQAVPTERFIAKAVWCGFCSQVFGSVDERMNHVAEHFGNGFRMEAWVPCGDY